MVGAEQSNQGYASLPRIATGPEAKHWEPSLGEKMQELLRLKLDKRDPVILAEALRSHKSYADITNDYALHREGIGERALKNLGRGAAFQTFGSVNYLARKTDSSTLAHASTLLEFAEERLEVANPGSTDHYFSALGGAIATVVPGGGAGALAVKFGVSTTKTASYLSSLLSAELGATAGADQVFTHLLANGTSVEAAQFAEGQALITNLALLGGTYKLGLFSNSHLPTSRFIHATGSQGVAAGTQTALFNILTDQELSSNLQESFVLGITMGGTLGTGRAMMRAQLLENMRVKYAGTPVRASAIGPSIYKDAEPTHLPDPTPEVKQFLDSFDRHVAAYPRARQVPLPENLVKQGYGLDVMEVASIPQNKLAQLIPYFCPSTVEFLRIKGVKKFDPEMLPRQLKEEMRLAARFDSFLGLPDEYIRWQNEKDQQFEIIAKDDKVLRDLEATPNPSKREKTRYLGRLTDIFHAVYGSTLPFASLGPTKKTNDADGFYTPRYAAITTEESAGLESLRAVAKHENQHAIQHQIIQSQKYPFRGTPDTTALSPNTLKEAAQRLSASSEVAARSNVIYGHNRSALYDNNLVERNADQRMRPKGSENGTSLKLLSTEQLRNWEQLSRHLNSFTPMDRYLGFSAFRSSPIGNDLKFLSSFCSTAEETAWRLGKTKTDSYGNRRTSLDDRPIENTARYFVEASTNPFQRGMLEAWYPTASPKVRENLDALLSKETIDPAELWRFLHSDYSDTRKQIEALNAIALRSGNE